MNVPKLVLASNSPRRRQLIALGGWAFRVAPADIDETPLPAEAPRDYVARLALGKAQALLPKAAQDETIVAADTTVADGMEILGKPVDAADARRMLRQLCGRTHQVYTAVAVVPAASRASRVEVCATDVPMRAYSDLEIEQYIASGDPFDKAGAYAIQHSGFRPVTGLAGCYANVMGLPLCHLTRLLRQVGIQPASDVPARCQAVVEYACPVFVEILGADYSRPST